jgi:hypothetical protein
VQRIDKTEPLHESFLSLGYYTDLGGCGKFRGKERREVAYKSEIRPFAGIEYNQSIRRVKITSLFS